MRNASESVVSVFQNKRPIPVSRQGSSLVLSILIKTVISSANYKQRDTKINPTRSYVLDTINIFYFFKSKAELNYVTSHTLYYHRVAQKGTTEILKRFQLSECNLATCG